MANTPVGASLKPYHDARTAASSMDSIAAPTTTIACAGKYQDSSQLLVRHTVNVFCVDIGYAKIITFLVMARASTSVGEDSRNVPSIAVAQQGEWAPSYVQYGSNKTVKWFLIFASGREFASVGRLSAEILGKLRKASQTMSPTRSS
jgi:hypothetical protein